MEQGSRITIELPREVENQLESQYVERLVAETNLRQSQLAEFRAAIAERLASIDEGKSVDGEEVMGRLLGDIAAPRSENSNRNLAVVHGARDVPAGVNQRLP